MRRLTVSNPTDNLSQLLNFAYAEGERVRLAYAGMRHGADLCEYIAGEAGDAGLSCAPSTDDVMEGSCMECDCVFGVLNNVAIQAAELRARLMKIEDILGEDYDLDRLREFVRTERRWIPVTERLPESGVRVIVCRGDKVEQGVFLGVNGWWKVYGTNTKKVTHWMPLPEPPKEGA